MTSRSICGGVERCVRGLRGFVRGVWIGVHPAMTNSNPHCRSLCLLFPQQPQQVRGWRPILRGRMPSGRLSREELVLWVGVGKGGARSVGHRRRRRRPSASVVARLPELDHSLGPVSLRRLWRRLWRSRQPPSLAAACSSVLGRWRLFQGARQRRRGSWTPPSPLRDRRDGDRR